MLSGRGACRHGLMHRACRVTSGAGIIPWKGQFSKGTARPQRKIEQALAGWPASLRVEMPDDLGD
jgi:hypothetical protein